MARLDDVRFSFTRSDAKAISRSSSCSNATGCRARGPIAPTAPFTTTGLTVAGPRHVGGALAVAGVALACAYPALLSGTTLH